MKLRLTPISRGIERQADDSAQAPGALRDGTGLISKSLGILDGVYRGYRRAISSGDAITRWIQWGNKTVILKTNPVGNIQASDGATNEVGPAGEGRAELYEQAAAVAVPNGQGFVLVDNTASIIGGFVTYLGLNDGYGLFVSGTPAGAAYTVTLSIAGTDPRIEVPAGKTPQYVIFDVDSNDGSTTARVRPVTGYTTSGGYVQTVTYTGTAEPAGTVHVQVIFGTSHTDTFSPDGFSTYRDRLTAWKDQVVYYSGYPGLSTPFVEPDVSNWSYWDGLNVVRVGHSGQGNIQRCITVHDRQYVFLESGIYVITGYPPIDGAVDNQLVVTEVSSSLGIAGYDAATLSDDGQTVYFIGNDGNVYALGAGIAEISRQIREHPRFNRLTHIADTEQFIVVSGVELDPSQVPYEDGRREGGLLYQSPATWVYNKELQAWFILDHYSATDTGYLQQTVDPAQLGAFGRYDIDGLGYLAVGEPGELKILFDPNTEDPDFSNYYMAGLATHEIIAGGLELKNPTAAYITAENVKSRTITAVSPANTPAGIAPVAKSKGEARTIYGDTSRYSLYFRRPPLHNYISAAVGYWGEKLRGGMSRWYPGNISMAVGTQKLQKVTLGSYVSRVDALLSDVVDCELHIYADNAGVPDTSTTLYTIPIEEPQSGLYNTSTPRWYTFNVRIPIVGPYWVALSGNANAYRYPSQYSIWESGAELYAGYGIAMRVIEELGAPLSVGKVLSVELEFDVVGDISA